MPIEDTYVVLAERLRNARNRGGYIRLVNGGVGDVGLGEELAILSERGLAVQPDHVLIVFFTNDSRPPWGFAGELGTRGWLRPRSILVDELYRG